MVAKMQLDQLALYQARKIKEKQVLDVHATSTFGGLYLKFTLQCAMHIVGGDAGGREIEGRCSG